jgi:hypothetical protein
MHQQGCCTPRHLVSHHGLSMLCRQSQPCKTVSIARCTYAYPLFTFITLEVNINRPIGLQEFGQLADVVAHLEVKQESS